MTFCSVFRNFHLSLNYRLLLGALSFLIFFDHAHAIEITIQNDLRSGEQGSVLEVEDAISWESPKTRIKFRVLPKETKPVTAGNLKSVTVSSIFPAGKIKYQISCDNSANEKATLTLLKIYNQELPSACRLDAVGHWSKKAGIHWEKPAKKAVN